MRKKAEEKKRSSCRDDEEYVKSAAWAWYQHGGAAPAKLLRESDAQNRQNSASTATRPSRFKLEAERAKSLDGLQKSTVGGFLMFEPPEKDVGYSSLLDHYEIVELSRHLEKSLSISVQKSGVEKSWIERGISTDLVHTQTVDKKRGCRAPKAGMAKRWWTPAMCSVTDVVIPQMAVMRSPKGSPSRQPRRSGSKKNGEFSASERFHGVRQRLRQALVLSPVNSPPRGKNNLAPSARRHSSDSSQER